MFKISSKLAAMVNTLPKKNDQIFGKQKPRNVASHLRRVRKRLAEKLHNPRLNYIHFHTLRHFKGTMLYHKTKDIYHVMQALGHKNIKNTLLYIQLEEALFQGEQDYISKVAKTQKEICTLIDAGFEYITDFEDAKIFRKPKM